MLCLIKTDARKHPLTAEIKNFPHDQSHVSSRRVMTDIEILSKVIALMALEWKRSHYCLCLTIALDSKAEADLNSGQLKRLRNNAGNASDRRD